MVLPQSLRFVFIQHITQQIVVLLVKQYFQIKITNNLQCVYYNTSGMEHSGLETSYRYSGVHMVMPLTRRNILECSRTVLLKLSDVVDLFFFQCSLTIVFLFSGKYPCTSRRWYVYHHWYTYHTLRSTVLEYSRVLYNVCMTGKLTRCVTFQTQRREDDNLKEIVLTVACQSSQVEIPN